MGIEDRLWAELASDHAERLQTIAALDPRGGAGRRSRLPRPAILATGGAGVVAATAAAIVALGATGAAPAFAVTTNADGTVTVTLSDIAAISGVNAELAADGINARAIPVRSGCSTPGFGFAWPSGTDADTATITLDPKDIPTGYTGIVAVEQEPSGQLLMEQAALPSPGPSCLSSIAVPHLQPGAGAATGNTGQ